VVSGSEVSVRQDANIVVAGCVNVSDTQLTVFKNGPISENTPIPVGITSNGENCGDATFSNVNIISGVCTYKATATRYSLLRII
jgi:hypothetical protein